MSSQEEKSQEERISLAIQAINARQIRSIRAASRTYNVPLSTLVHRLQGRKPREAIRHQKLTADEEKLLIERIVSMDERGYPLRMDSMKRAAEVILARRDGSRSSPPTMGSNWVFRFVNRHPDIKDRYSRSYAKGKRETRGSPEVIREWFERVRSTIEKYSIAWEDVYNFDETGFRMGMIHAAKVVTGTDKTFRRKALEHGDNAEWVSVIEGINSSGWALPPMIIVKGKRRLSAWSNGLPDGWRIEVSDDGWSNEKLGLVWLKEIFNKHTKSHALGQHRLLILNGYGGHNGPEFDQFCVENSIIPLYMPVHSAYFLQPLDVGCATPLEQSYRRELELRVQFGIQHIDKDWFLAIYPSVRAQPLSEENIRNGFRDVGLVPLNPDLVLSRPGRRANPSAYSAPEDFPEF